MPSTSNDIFSSPAILKYRFSPTITAILLPEGHDADKFRALALETFNISYGASFGQYAGKYFRIGHLGDISDTQLIGALGATDIVVERGDEGVDRIKT